MQVFKRILTSKKFITGVAGIVGAILVAFFDVDYTEQILTLLTTVTGLLIGGQSAIDFRHGSPSDRV